MRSDMHKDCRRVYRTIRHGQAIVEMALVGSVMVILLVVAVESGVALSLKHALNCASREAAIHVTSASVATQQRTSSAAEQIVRESLARRYGENSPVADNATVTVSPAGGQLTPGRRITVSVSYPLPDGWLINRSGNVRIQGQSVFEAQ